VRMSRKKAVFEKGYKRGWTMEIFKVVEQIPRIPVVYRLNDLNDKPIEGTFYTQELIKVKKPEIYDIEKVIKKRGKKLFVKWVGYPKSLNSWIDAKDVLH
jgi:hypothetical protein